MLIYKNNDRKNATRDIRGERGRIHGADKVSYLVVVVAIIGTQGLLEARRCTPHQLRCTTDPASSTSG